MEFWGLEVKPGTTVRCQPGDDYILHLSQAALGESKKGSDNALMYVKVNDEKLAIGTLSADKYPQIQFDLVFEKDFELSHTSKDEMDFDSEEDEDEEELNIDAAKENGKVEGKKEQKIQVKTGAAASKSDVAVKKQENNKNDDDSDEDETDDSDDDEGLSPEEDDEDDSDEEDSSEDDEDESDEDEEEETPKKPEAGKKRAAENALKTPASDNKKAKVATPSTQKTGGKKGGHVATPHPAKQASKTPANNDKSKSPKSAGSVACKSCTKTFNSQMALEAHSKVKHPGAK
ncbi:hypothetical protein ACP70R_040604 [Stipagrostis hirtigluma subsp. patula]